MRAVGGRRAEGGEVAGVRGGVAALPAVRNTARKSLEKVAEVEAEVEAEVVRLVEGGVVPRWAPTGPREELRICGAVAVRVLVLV